MQFQYPSEQQATIYQTIQPHELGSNVYSAAAASSKPEASSKHELSFYSHYSQANLDKQKLILNERLKDML